MGETAPINSSSPQVYPSRKPSNSPYYQCIEDHIETFGDCLGFNVFCGKRIYPGDERRMENLARYIIHGSFSQERMTYLGDESTVVYQGKDAKRTKTFDALEWLAAMCSPVPNRGEQRVRYYGYYSNVLRGKSKKQTRKVILIFQSGSVARPHALLYITAIQQDGTTLLPHPW